MALVSLGATKVWHNLNLGGGGSAVKQNFLLKGSMDMCGVGGLKPK